MDKNTVFFDCFFAIAAYHAVQVVLVELVKWIQR